MVFLTRNLAKPEQGHGLGKADLSCLVEVSQPCMAVPSIWVHRLPLGKHSYGT